MAEVQLGFACFEEEAELEENAVEHHIPSSMSLTDKVALVIETLVNGILYENWELCASVSGGKDSMTTLSQSLVSAAQAFKKLPAGITRQTLHIVSSDTLMENILKAKYLDEQFELAHKYGVKYGFNVEIHRPAPERTASFVRIFSGGRPDPTPSINSVNKQCAGDYKIDPIHKAMRGINKSTKNDGKKLVMLVGSRSEESTRRANSLVDSGASNIEPIFVKGYWTLYPVMHWTLDDIWQYLVFAEEDLESDLPGYQSGFEDVVELYASLNGGECVAGLEQGEQSCGARDGCHQCAIVSEDKSGINQANSKDLYHLRSTFNWLLALRDFRVNLGKNFQNRNFVSMIDAEGSISLKPNGYAGWLLEENLRIALTAMANEYWRAHDLKKAVKRIKGKIADGTMRNPERANRWLKKVSKHTEPLLEMLNTSDIVWIDFQWSLRGLTRKAHSALRIYDEICNNGQWEKVKLPTKSYKRPSHVSDKEYKTVLKMPPKARIVHGLTFDDEMMENFSEPMFDAFEGDCTSQETYQINKKGKEITAESMQVSDKYHVDDESSDMICHCPSMFCDFDKVDSEPYEFRHQNAVNRHLRFGVISANKAQLKGINEKLELLHFTATEGLQELAYVGGEASLRDFPNIHFEAKDNKNEDNQLDFVDESQFELAMQQHKKFDSSNVIQMFQ